MKKSTDEKKRLRSYCIWCTHNNQSCDICETGNNRKCISGADNLNEEAVLLAVLTSNWSDTWHGWFQVLMLNHSLTKQVYCTSNVGIKGINLWKLPEHFRWTCRNACQHLYLLDRPVQINWPPLILLQHLPALSSSLPY